MRRVAQVLEVELPVALVAVLEHAARRLELAVGGAIDHVVEGGGHVAEMIREARAVRREAAEDEAAIARDPRHAQHRKFGILRIEVGGIAVLQRDRLEPAVQVIGQAVVAAAEFRGMPSFRRHDHRAAVGALVVQERNPAGGIAHEQQRLASDPGGEKVPRIPDLAFVPDIDPRGAEDSLQLELEHLRVAIEAPVDAAGLNQGTDVVAGDHVAPPRNPSILSPTAVAPINSPIVFAIASIFQFLRGPWVPDLRSRWCARSSGTRDLSYSGILESRASGAKRNETRDPGATRRL